MSDLPEGEYAIVEVLGHRTYAGRISEVDRFGTKLLQIEPIFRGKLLDPVLVGGGSIYQFTPCSAETAYRYAPREDYCLPTPVRERLPVELIAAPIDCELFETEVETIDLPDFLRGGIDD